jgi:hypothetical protein
MDQDQIGWHGWFATLGGSDVLGTLGVILYVGAYLALQLGVLRATVICFLRST